MCRLLTRMHFEPELSLKASQRLDVLQALMSEAGQSQTEFLSENKMFSAQIHQQMQELHEEFLSPKAPASLLKDSLVPKIDRLIDVLEQFLRKGHERERHLRLPQ